MRVVETVSGGGQQTVGPHASSTSSQSSQQTISTMTPLTTASPQGSPLPAATPLTANVSGSPLSPPASTSIQSIGLRTVTGQTVVPPSSPTQLHNSYAPAPQSPASVGTPNVLNPNCSLQQQHLRTVLRPSAPTTPPTSALSHSTTIMSNNVYPTTVRVQQSKDTSTPSLSNHPINNRSTPTAIAAQIPVKAFSHLAVNHTTNLAPITNEVTNSNLVQHSANHVGGGHSAMAASAATVTSGGGGVGATATNFTSGLAQVSSQSLTQQLYTPSTNLVTPSKDAEGGEEGWLISWLRTGFESGTATSIEQEKCYGMYCCNRKDQSAVLPMERFLQVVK
jgi:hypothetical protein